MTSDSQLMGDGGTSWAPDRDKPRRWTIYDHPQLGWKVAEGSLASAARTNGWPVVEVVESSPGTEGQGRRAVTDEDVERAVAGVIEATGGALTQDEAEFYARAVLDAVFKRADSEARAAGYVPLSEVVEALRAEAARGLGDEHFGFKYGSQLGRRELVSEHKAGFYGAAHFIEREFSDRGPSDG